MPHSNSLQPFTSDLLAGKTALVTGSGSGIGRAIALALAGAGADVHLHARSNREGIATGREQIAAMGRGGDDHLADLSDIEGCEQLAAKFAPGEIDILVNNAGADVLTGEAASWSFEKKLEVLWQVDVQATVVLGRTIGQQMKQQGSGVVLTIGWDQVAFGMDGDAGEMFATSKGAVEAFTRSLTKSLAPEVRVNCIAPGWIKTAWGESCPDYWDRRVRAESLLGRWGQVDDIAHLACFLASPAASFINGQVISVDGGFAGSRPE